MIAPYFPPRARVGAQRPLKFARYLPQHGFAPSIVSLASPLADSEQTSVLDVPELRLLVPFERSAGGPGPGPRERSTRRDLVDRLDAWVPIDSWWPVLMAQLPRVLAFARAQAPDVIWSTADPWSSHALALRVARALALPWVADFRDPWTLCEVRGRCRPAWVRAIDARAERCYLSHAAAVTFTAARTTERYRAAYPALAARFHTVENSFDPALYADACEDAQSARAVAPGRALTLTFLGRFRRLSGVTRVAEVLATLRRQYPDAADVRVRSTGPLDERDSQCARALGVADAFEAIAPVHVSRTLELMRGSDVALLSTEPDRDEIIPAKLFDYLAAGRPILALADNPDSEAILRATGLGLQFGRDQIPVAARVLADCVVAKRAGARLPLSVSYDPYRSLAFSSERTSARLAFLLQRVCAPEPREGERPYEVPRSAS